jgi:hypothetical protein
VVQLFGKPYLLVKREDKFMLIRGDTIVTIYGLDR